MNNLIFLIKLDFKDLLLYTELFMDHKKDLLLFYVNILQENGLISSIQDKLLLFL